MADTNQTPLEDRPGSPTTDQPLDPPEQTEAPPVVEGFAAARESLAAAIEEAAPAAHEDQHAGPTHYVGNTTVLFGRVIPLPVYTVVFIALGILTLFELALAEVFPRGGLTIPIMLLASLTKAALVVWFYMHLNSDSRVFALTLLIPVVMVLLATGFLMIVPIGY
ncbi:MAG: cytochrome C oxidase subunit IV family protein [Chloroflexi bacterium]|nr:cytochrome C oxidase subunit IV family protein [Chloroflexota bacterium]